MATLVPDTQPVFIPGSPVLRYYPNSGSRYRMSVIIFNRRTSYSRLLTAGPNAANRVINQEILAEVYLPGTTFTTRGNASTKEIHIRSAFPYRSSDDAALQPNDIAGATWSDVKVGSWIALLQFEGGSRPAKNLSWFQVTSATDLPANGEFVFSLKGPDWNFDVQTYAIYVNDVVSVFEKTIRLHESSAYTN